MSRQQHGARHIWHNACRPMCTAWPPVQDSCSSNTQLMEALLKPVFKQGSQSSVLQLQQAIERTMREPTQVDGRVLAAGWHHRPSAQAAAAVQQLHGACYGATHREWGRVGGNPHPVAAVPRVSDAHPPPCLQPESKRMCPWRCRGQRRRNETAEAGFVHVSVTAKLSCRAVVEVAQPCRIDRPCMSAQMLAGTGWSFPCWRSRALVHA